MKAPVLASAAPVTLSAKVTGQSVIVPSDTEEDNTEDEASAASTTQPAQESQTVAETPSLGSNDMPAAGEGSNMSVVERILRTKTREEPKRQLFFHQAFIPYLTQTRCYKCLKQHSTQLCLKGKKCWFFFFRMSA